MEYIGIDVHQRESQVCIVDEDGHVLVERRVRTREGAVRGAPRGAGPRAGGAGGVDRERMGRAALEVLGHEVIVADPNFAPMYATRSRRVKTDRRDARTLADACRLGAYRATHRTSAARARSGAARGPGSVGPDADAVHQCAPRGARRDGVRVPSGGAAPFGQRVQTLRCRRPRRGWSPRWWHCSSPSTGSWRPLRPSARGVAAHAAARRLCTVPGVGPVTAAAVVATLDDVRRFARAGQVGGVRRAGAARAELGRAAPPRAAHEGGQ